MSTNTALDDIKARAEVNQYLGKTASQDEAKDTLKLIAALEAVEALHRPVLEDGEPVGCRVCDWSEDDYWPCATLRNIEEALR